MNKELEKLKAIEKAFEDAYYSVLYASDLMRTLDKDYNVNSDGFAHFISQLRNYTNEYTIATNNLLRKIVDERGLT